MLAISLIKPVCLWEPLACSQQESSNVGGIWNVLQVLVVGDLNIAASQSDVHSGCNWDEMYSPAEKAVLHALLSELTDTWRLLHPNTENAFTVWDEKTNARPFNRVSAVVQSSANRV